MKDKFFLSIQSVSVMALFFFPSCQNLVGFGIPPDFDKKEWELTSDKQDITLTAKNDVDWWSLEDLTINGEALPSDNWDGDDRIVVYSSKEKNPDYPHIYHFGIYRIAFQDWFVWERFGNKTIRIRLTENESGKDREVRFVAFAGNASDNIRIVQKAK